MFPLSMPVREAPQIVIKNHIIIVLSSLLDSNPARIARIALTSLAPDFSLIHPCHTQVFL